MFPVRLQMRILLFVILSGIALTSRVSAALLWKDDFTDEMIHELVWNAKKTTGSVTLENNRCVMNVPEDDPFQHNAIITLPSRSLPPNFDLHASIEFTNVDAGEGEFYVRIGDQAELVISFGSFEPSIMEKEKKDAKWIFVHEVKTGSIFEQTSEKTALYTHNIVSGERYFITWLSNGERPALNIIKVGTAPGESNVADFLIETSASITGVVEIGARKGIREIRLNYVRAYLFGASSSLVHDWVLF